MADGLLRRPFCHVFLRDDKASEAIHAACSRIWTLHELLFTLSLCLIVNKADSVQTLQQKGLLYLEYWKSLDEQSLKQEVEKLMQLLRADGFRNAVPRGNQPIDATWGVRFRQLIDDYSPWVTPLHIRMRVRIYIDIYIYIYGEG